MVTRVVGGWHIFRWASRRSHKVLFLHLRIKRSVPLAWDERDEKESDSSFDEEVA